MARYYKSMDQPSAKPFEKLGEQLKTLRESSSESMAEVSGAVEIDTRILQRIENGLERPSEDVLMLLISHFGMRDNEAVELWELAGYDQPTGKNRGLDDSNSRPVLMMMALDTRILYSDNAHIAADNNGLVLNFLQKNGAGDQQLPIARIGMSYDHARDVLRALQQSLDQADALKRPKGLPAPKSGNKKPGLN